MERFVVFGFDDADSVSHASTAFQLRFASLAAADGQTFEPLAALTLEDVRKKLMSCFEGEPDAVAEGEPEAMRSGRSS